MKLGQRGTILGLKAFILCASPAVADPSAYVAQLSHSGPSAYIQQLSATPRRSVVVAKRAPQPQAQRVPSAPAENITPTIYRRNIDQLPHVRDGVRIFISN